MTWGEQNTVKEAHEQLDYAIDAGINFIDTAEMYPVPPKPETVHLTEEYIGKWGKLKLKRDKIILATKVVGPGDWVSYVRNIPVCLDKKNINLAVEGSLKRLQTDYIDLYQLHWPDRETNFFGKLGFDGETKNRGTPIEESLSVLTDLVKQGKIRHIGVSNETPWGMMKFLELSKALKLEKIVTIQNPYNLLNRTFEIGLAEISLREQVGLLAYSPMAFGMLSGKYLNGARPKGARITEFSRFTRYTSDKAAGAIKKYCDIAFKYNLKPSQMALAFVNTRPFVTSNIIGATNLDQLKENIESIKMGLSQNVLNEIEAVHVEITNPCP
jgi:aryl-alcohol dehydrogenase-like predicted oxidoreductase